MGGTANTPARARRQPGWYAVMLVVALALAGCGGQGPTRAQSGSSAPAQSSSTAASPSSGATTSLAPVPPEKAIPRYGMPTPAQCFLANTAQVESTIATAGQVDCSHRHTTVIAWTGLVKKPVTSQTPIARRLQVARQRCLPAFRRAVGGSADQRAMSLLGWTMFTPSTEQLVRGARWVRCDVFAQSGSQLVPLPEKLPILGRGIPEALRVCQGADGTDISCGRSHTYRVEKVFPVSSYPGPSYQRRARDRCDRLMGPGGYWQPPSREGWNAGDHYVRCLSKNG